MRYINLLDRIAHVKTHRCFLYNNTIVFAVPAPLMSKAVGINGKNVRMIQDTLGRRIKIVKDANGLEDVERFMRDIVDPVGFKSAEVMGDEVVITAGSQYKAALIGRNRGRLIELSQIIHDSFGKQVRIV